MPNGPIDGLLFAHTAIEADARRIEAEAHSAESPQAAAALAADAAFLADVVAKHTDGEEVGLYPTLIQKVPNIDKTFLFDHDDDKQQFADLSGLIDRCGKEDSGTALAALRRQTIAITEHLAIHIRKENEIVLPLVGEHFAPPAQVEMIQGVLSKFTPEDMVRVVPFITRLQARESAVAYVKVLAATMPPPVFDKAKGWLKDGISAELFQYLSTAVAELGSP